jgi:hypothetical protein
MSWRDARGRVNRTRAAVAAAVAVAIAALAPAAAQAVPIPGSPLEVFTSPDGNLQANLEGHEANVFFPPTDDIGAAGFFIGMPEAVGTIDAGTTFGPSEVPAGSNAVSQPYEAVSQSPVFGTGTAGDPYWQETVYMVRAAEAVPPATDVLEVVQTVNYVNGRRSFDVTYDVTNETGSAVRYRASAAADLYLDGSDIGVGYFSQGPPRVVGGINETTGRAGGIQEVASSPWDAHQETEYFSIWSIVGNPLDVGFDNSILSNSVDNGVGVQWDDKYSVGLAAGATRIYNVTWQFGIAGLTASPVGAALNQGATHTVTFTGTNADGGPLANATLRYAVTGPNARSGAVATGPQGQAAVAWTGANAGTDVIEGYLDLNGDGTRGTDEPRASATVLFKAPDAPLPTTPGNAFTFAGAPIFGNGTTTLIVVVPGPGQISVTPAGSASASISAKKKGKKKAKKKPALIKKTTVNVTKAGPVKVKIKPTKAGKKVLKRKGKLTTKVHVTFTPTGGQANTVTRKVTIKKKKAAKGKGKGGKGRR